MPCIVKGCKHLHTDMGVFFVFVLIKISVFVLKNIVYFTVRVMEGVVPW